MSKVKRKVTKDSGIFQENNYIRGQESQIQRQNLVCDAYVCAHVCLCTRALRPSMHATHMNFILQSQKNNICFLESEGNKGFQQGWKSDGNMTDPITVKCVSFPNLEKTSLEK